MSRRAKKRRSRENQSVARRRAGSVAKPNRSVEIASVTQSTATWSGPLPPPAALKQYDDLVPGTAASMVRMSESQAEHRMEMEKTVIVGDSKRSYIGLFFAFILSVGIVSSGTYIAIFVHPWAGSSVIGTGVAGLAGVFVYGTNSRRRERERKASEPRA